MTPEAKSRYTIDALLEQASWPGRGMADANIHAARGLALREFPLNTDYGFADYRESTGIETHFTQGLDPQSRGHSVFAYNGLETLAALFSDAIAVHPQGASTAADSGFSAPVAAGETSAGFATMFLGRMQAMPLLVEVGLWPAYVTAIHNLECVIAFSFLAGPEFSE